MPTTITSEKLKEKIDAGEDLVLINVLTPESFEREHIPGSINIPLRDINEETVAKLPRGKETIVYCGSFECMASPVAAQKLEELGFTTVVDYEGGMADWKEAGYSVEAGAHV